MKYDCLFVGNAIVDILTDVSFEFMNDQGIEPGSWRPVEKEEIEKLQSLIPDNKVTSGGSAANSAVGFSFLGGSSAFIGRVKNDTLGLEYIKDMDDAGVNFTSNPSESGLDTGRCLVYVTPDAQRSMRTYLGAASQLSPDEVDEESIINSSIVYLEGYLWDIPDCNEIANKVIKEKNRSSVRIALSLSDSFCVERHFEAFSELTRDAVDIIFANENEMMVLTRTETIEDMIEASKNLGNLSVITLGERGSIVVNKGDVTHAEAQKTSNVVDTTGAGDTYTAAFLFGLLSNKSIQECAEMASWAASQVIQQIGARLDNETIKKCPLL